MKKTCQNDIETSGKIGNWEIFPIENKWEIWEITIVKYYNPLNKIENHA